MTADGSPAPDTPGPRPSLRPESPLGLSGAGGDPPRGPAPPSPRPPPGRAACPRPGTAGTRGAARPPTPADLLALGPEGYGSPDLLAVLLGEAGGPGGPPALARRLLERLGSLRRVAAASPAELRALGVPPRTAARLGAAFALGRRVHGERLPPGRHLRGGAEVFEAFHARLRDLRKERFLTVLLDGKNRVLREDLVSEGILTASLVHPREVFAPAIREGAGGLLLVHNHPSGDPEPSAEDVEVTQRLVGVGDLVGIRVLDHVVVGDGRYVSFLERGLL